MKVQIFKRRIDIISFEFRNALVLLTFCFPMIFFVYFNLSRFYAIGLVLLFLGLFCGLSLRLFSNDKIRVTETGLKFENFKIKELEFAKIRKIIILEEYESFRNPFFLLIFLNDTESYFFIRIDQFDFKNPRHQLKLFMTKLQKNYHGEIEYPKNEFLSTMIIKLKNSLLDDGFHKS